MTFRSLSTQILKKQSYIAGLASLTVINLISRFLGLLLLAMIPRVFGINSATDLFFFFTGLSTKCSNFLCSVNRTVLIPHAIQLRESGNAPEGVYIYSKISSTYLIIFLIIIGFIASFPNTALPFFSRFDSSVIANNQVLIIGLLINIFLDLLNLVLNDWLFYMRYFLISASLGILGMLLYLTILISIDGSIGVLGLVLGMIVFKLLQICILTRISRDQITISRTPIPRGIKTKVFAVYGSSLFSLIFETLPLLIISSYSPGSISSLAYAQLLASIPYLLLVDQSEQVAGVHFAELGAKGDLDAMNQAFRNSLERLMAILIPLCALFWLVSYQMTSLIFGRLGDPGVLKQSGELLAYLVWLPPLLAINGFTSKVVIGKRHVLAGALHQTLMALIGLVIIYTFMKKNGLVGYGQGVCLFYSIQVGTLGFLCTLTIPRFSYFKALIAGLKNGCLLGCPSYFFAWLMTNMIQSASPLTQIILATLSFAISYLIAFSLLIGPSYEKLTRYICATKYRGNDRP
jgi:O-antigen/teichoic acid export membrane protein